jgi:hypothetical protein
MSTKDETPAITRSEISVGAGLAIAGIWLAAAAVTIVVFLTVFLWAPSAAPVHLDGWAALWLLMIIASPMIAAYILTKKILSIKD